MKRIIIFIALVLGMATYAFAGSMFSIHGSYALVTGATGTITGSAVPMSDPYDKYVVDVITLGTGSVIVRIDGTGVQGDTTFDSSGIGTAITCTAIKCTTVYVDKPMYALRAVITDATGTNSTTVKVTGVGR